MSKEQVVDIRVKTIGESVARKEDATLLTGRGQYIADIQLPGMLHAAFIRSPFAHAKITHIDVTAAAEVPGVELVWTGADVHEHTTGITSTLEVEGFVGTTQPAIAYEVVRFVGEAVAVVVASTSPFGIISTTASYMAPKPISLP